ncbi:AEC family transporter [Motiliproteus coralliicola]|uniref:AEC family transporter n=1 Tax=Motiliproteus coralliicola TaxID=2283196 RepID=A0A369W9C9_9GAMM|nr:AEC family transporter [Motiliproteus coralliicola]RDE18267.1 AEC family transporter [Motiliproteus coralliicola]
MDAFLNNLQFSLSITGPIFIVMTLGWLLNRRGMINDNFIDIGSKLVFNVTLPALLFINISRTSIEQTANLTLLGVGLFGTLLLFLLFEFLVARRVEPSSERGVVVQGAFRSNMGIIGLAYCFNAYGNDGLVTASLYLALVTILFNILSVITLSRSLNRDTGFRSTLKGILKNPLIIGIVMALPLAWYQVELPAMVLRTGEYFAQMTLPLALLCTGASLNFSALRHDRKNAMLAASLKLLVVPLTLTLGGILLGLRGIELGVLLLMTCSPTAAASYVMVRAMGGNATLAANIIAITTLCSLLTTSAGVTLLKLLELI